MKIILVDPTHYLDLYNDIIHLLSPVIHFDDRVISAFKWLHAEYDRRLEQFARAGVRDLTAYNASKSEFEGVPRILVVTFADLYPAEVEDPLIRLTAHGARTGIHSIIVSDHASGSTLPTLLKSNIPARAVFRLTSIGESRAIDVSGGEKLAPGELIYKPNYGNPEKLKAVFTPEINVNEVVKAIKEAGGGRLNYS